MATNSKKTKSAERQLMVWMSQAQHDKLKRIAAAEHRSLASIIRELIDETRDYELRPMKK